MPKKKNTIDAFKKRLKKGGDQEIEGKSIGHSYGRSSNKKTK
jgi:hypothetical protein